MSARLAAAIASAFALFACVAAVSYRLALPRPAPALPLAVTAASPLVRIHWHAAMGLMLYGELENCSGVPLDHLWIRATALCPHIESGLVTGVDRVPVATTVEQPAGPPNDHDGSKPIPDSQFATVLPPGERWKFALYGVTQGNLCDLSVTGIPSGGSEGPLAIDAVLEPY